MERKEKKIPFLCIPVVLWIIPKQSIFTISFVFAIVFKQVTRKTSSAFSVPRKFDMWIILIFYCARKSNPSILQAKGTAFQPELTRINCCPMVMQTSSSLSIALTSLLNPDHA